MTVRRSIIGPATMVVVGTAIFASLSAANSARMAPCWGQDLAFFHQLIHSAATGGPWSTPLLLEPRGFFDMVHMHLVLPLVVGVYALVPRQEVLLGFQAAFASLALWPAWRLGERVHGTAGGVLATLSVMLFGPFQGLAMADFRPSALFLPGILGVLVSARERRPAAVVCWSLVALLGRQEAVYLLGGVAVMLVCTPWADKGPWRRRFCVREGAVVGTIAVGALLWFLAVKPAMFYHFDPLRRPDPATLSPDHLADRLSFLGQLAQSGAVVGLLSPMPLLPLLPVAREMLETGREWGPVVGPAAHYAAFWLPFVIAAWLTAAQRRGGRVLLGVVAVANAVSLPWPGLRTGPMDLMVVEDKVGPTERVAADYDTIHRLSGRAVLWNTAQLRMAQNERPRGWVGDWPVPLSAVDVLILRHDDPLRSAAVDWPIRHSTDTHVILERPASLAPTASPYGVDPASLVRPRRERSPENE